VKGLNPYKNLTAYGARFDGTYWLTNSWRHRCQYNFIDYGICLCV